MLEEIRAHQTGMGAVAIVDATGRRLSALPAEVMSGEIEILRGDLARILHQATGEGATYLFGDTVTSLAQDADGAHVTFARHPPRTYDLVVGADGIHSAVRRLAFGPVQPRHLGVYGATFTVPDHLSPGRGGAMYSEPGTCAGVYGYRTHVKGTLDFASPPLDFEPDDLDRQKRLCADAFAGQGWHVPHLLEAMWQAPDFYFDAACQIRLDHYSTGRVVLLGDAGYCAGPGGMGTGLAVVGAYVLACELASADDHQTAFDHYERRMRPYVTRCQGQADGVEKFLVPSRRRQIWMRNLTFKLLPHMPGKKLVNTLTTRAANAIDLDLAR